MKFLWVAGATLLASVCGACGGSDDADTASPASKETRELHQAAAKTLEAGSLRAEEYLEPGELFATVDYDIDADRIHRLMPAVEESIRIGDWRYSRNLTEEGAGWVRRPATSIFTTPTLLREATSATAVRRVGDALEFALGADPPLGLNEGDRIRMVVENGVVTRIEFVGGTTFVELSRLGIPVSIEAPPADQITEGSIPEVVICPEDPGTELPDELDGGVIDASQCPAGDE